MNTEKTTTRMGSTTVTQTAEGFELKNGPGIKDSAGCHIQGREE